MARAIDFVATSRPLLAALPLLLAALVLAMLARARPRTRASATALVAPLTVLYFGAYAAAQMLALRGLAPPAALACVPSATLVAVIGVIEIRRRRDARALAGAGS